MDAQLAVRTVTKYELRECEGKKEQFPTKLTFLVDPSHEIPSSTVNEDQGRRGTWPKATILHTCRVSPPFARLQLGRVDAPVMSKDSEMCGRCHGGTRVGGRFAW